MANMKKLLSGSVCGLLACGVVACVGPNDSSGPGTVTAPNASYEVSPDNRYIVKFHRAATRSRPDVVNPAGVRAVEGIGASIVRTLDRQNAVAMVVSADRLPRLFNDPSVEYIEVDRRRQKLTLDDVPYGIHMVQADQVSDSAAANRTVCIIDSGYSMGHEDLPGVANVTGAPDGGAGPWNEDGDGHGTHVAGTIAALANDVGVVGVLPSGTVNLRIVRVFGDDGIWAYASDLVAALAECDDAANGVVSNVISMSLGGGGPTTLEEQAFADAYAAGKLPVAAASNDGNTSYSYPASYDSVVSVGAIDESESWATFSNYNDKVELAAPGVAVRSTFPMGAGVDASLSLDGGGDYAAYAMEGSGFASVTAPLADCGNGTYRCTAAKNAICLVERGATSFGTMAKNCAKGGGLATVVYNNVAGPLSGTTLGSTHVSIPVVGVSADDGATLLAAVGTDATVAVIHGNYEYLDGTSMATPHVSAVAALIWSQYPTASNAQVREAMDMTAKDLGDSGRDPKYGFGLVQARDAVDYLATLGPCVPETEVCGDGADNDCDGYIDCFDPDCAGDQSCASADPENCTDGVDNDGDGAVDCADSDCASDPACQSSDPEICDDGSDNDGDGAVDCADSDCASDPACAGDGGQCTPCTSALDCGDGFACIWLSGQSQPYCLQACGKKGTACDTDYSCVRIIGGGFGDRCVSCE